MPRLVHTWLKQQVEGKHELALRSRDLNELAATMKGMQRRIVAAILGIGLLIVAAVLYGFEAGGPRILLDSRFLVDRRHRRAVGVAGGVAAALIDAGCRCGMADAIHRHRVIGV